MVYVYYNNGYSYIGENADKVTDFITPPNAKYMRMRNFVADFDTIKTNLDTLELSISPKAADVYGDIVVSKDTVDVVENGTETFKVKLDKAPTKDQVVSLASNNKTVTVSPESLTFTPQNYNQEQTVTITDDSTNIFGEIVLTNSTAEINEGSSLNRGVKLDRAPSNDQVITIKADQPWITLTKSSMTFTHDNFDTNQFVIVGVKANGLSSDSVGHVTFSSPNVSDTVLTVNGKNVEPDRDLQTSVIKKEQIEPGTFENGNPIVGNTYFRTKGFYTVDENSTYIFKEKNNLISSMVYIFYDEAKKFLSQVSDQSTSMVTPAGCKFIKLRSYSSDESTIRNNLDTIEITLRKQVPIKGISVSNQTIQVNSTVEITPTFDPLDTSEREFELSSSKPEFVEVVEGTKLKGIAVGSCTVGISSKTSPGVASTFTVEVTDGPLELKSISIETEPNSIPMEPQSFEIITDPLGFDNSLLNISLSSSDIIIDGDFIYYKSVGSYTIDVSYNNITTSADVTCTIPSGTTPDTIDFSDLFKSYEFKVGRLYNVTTKVSPIGANNSFTVTANPNNIVFSGNTIKFNDTRQTTLTIKSIDSNASSEFVVTPVAVAVNTMKLGSINNYMPINQNGIKTPLYLDPVDSVGDVNIEVLNDTNGIMTEKPVISNGTLEIKPTNNEGTAQLKLSSISNPDINILMDVDAKGFAPASLTSFAGGQFIYEPTIGYSNGKIYKLDRTLSDVNPKLALLNWEYPEVTIICIQKFQLASHYNEGLVAFQILDKEGFTCKIKQSDGTYLEPTKKVIKERNTELEPTGHRNSSIVMSVTINKETRKVRYMNHSYGSIYEYDLVTDLDTLEYENQQTILDQNKPEQLITSRLSFFTSTLTDEEIADCVQRITHDLKPQETSFFYGFDQYVKIGDKPVNVDSYWVSRHPSDERYQYKSDNDSLLTVDRNGWMTGLQPGTVHVTTEFKDVVYNTTTIEVKPSDYTSPKVELSGRSVLRTGEGIGGEK